MKWLMPFADEWDEKQLFPYEEVLKPMVSLVFFGTVIPEDTAETIWLACSMILTEDCRGLQFTRV